MIQIQFSSLFRSSRFNRKSFNLMVFLNCFFFFNSCVRKNSQDMGCLISTARDGGGNRRRPGNVGEIAVFVPGLRIPKAVDFLQSLGNCLPKSLVDRLTALRTRIVDMAGQEVPTATKSRRKTATRHG